jgi:hypothetical protein
MYDGKHELSNSFKYIYQRVKLSIVLQFRHISLDKTLTY